MKRNLANGELTITSHAIKKIVYFAVTESYGPVNIETDSFLGRIFGREEEKIRVEEREDSSVLVELFLDLEYGIKISEVARNIIDNVKHKLMELADISDVVVNVHITSLK